MNNEKLDIIFGKTNTVESPQERAKKSTMQYVRSQDELAVYIGKGQGRVYNAFEAYELFGEDKLLEAHLNNTAILTRDYNEPANTLKTQRENLGISIKDLAKKTNLTDQDIESIENKDVKSPIRKIETVARVLGLNDKNISNIKDLNKNSQLAIRLKTYSNGNSAEKAIISKDDIIKLTEVAWVIQTQNDLVKKIKNERLFWETIEKDENYGASQYPAWKHGYYLAYKLRDMLELEKDTPISSLRDLCENKLEIPLIYTDLSNKIAGVTIVSNNSRGIVLNEKTLKNTWIKRVSLAHEICHLLWDKDEKLLDIHIDNKETLVSFRAKDFIEQRANAFAAEFLAPQSAIENLSLQKDIKNEDISIILDTFGISYTAGQFQYRNTKNTEKKENICARETEPDSDWDGKERFALDYYPAPEVPLNRRGEFSNVVIKANKGKLISDDTAASYLCLENKKYIEKRNEIEDLFQ